MTLYLCSTTVVPAGAYGTWKVEPTSLASCRLVVAGESWVSAVGHESTAEVMSTLLQAEVPANRFTIKPEAGDRFLCFKLDSRPPEGAILDRQTLESLGYSFVLMTYEG